MSKPQHTCKNCKAVGVGRFCASCGQTFKTERLSVRSIFHEVFHFFTHLDHGFPYTLKKLFTSPGSMQKEYVEGVRQKYQKPFSMFFICATIAALAMYWINIVMLKYFDAGDTKEAVLFQKYWAILQIVMLPVYACITYLFFKKSKLNYGEIIVFQLYLFSFLFIAISLIHLLKFIYPHLQTRYIELPVIVLYTLITNLHFFKDLKKWIVTCLTIVCIVLCFFLANYVQDLLVQVF